MVYNKNMNSIDYFLCSNFSKPILKKVFNNLKRATNQNLKTTLEIASYSDMLYGAYIKEQDKIIYYTDISMHRVDIGFNVNKTLPKKALCFMDASMNFKHELEHANQDYYINKVIKDDGHKVRVLNVENISHQSKCYACMVKIASDTYEGNRLAFTKQFINNLDNNLKKFTYEYNFLEVLARIAQLNFANQYFKNSQKHQDYNVTLKSYLVGLLSLNDTITFNDKLFEFLENNKIAKNYYGEVLTYAKEFYDTFKDIVIECHENLYNSDSNWVAVLSQLIPAPVKEQEHSFTL